MNVFKYLETIPVIKQEHAERKPPAPSEMLQRVTERRLAETDRRVLHGVCHWTRLARYEGYRNIVLYGSL